MSKPRIKLVRRTDFSRKWWECRGLDCLGNETVGHGVSPGGAYQDWYKISEIPF